MIRAANARMARPSSGVNSTNGSSLSAASRAQAESVATKGRFSQSQPPPSMPALDDTNSRRVGRIGSMFLYRSCKGICAAAVSSLGWRGRARQ
jgi:hypothetical protein